MSTDLLPRTVISKICSARNLAIQEMTSAAELLGQAFKATHAADQAAGAAHAGANFSYHGADAEPSNQLFDEDFDTEKSIQAWTRIIDRRVWTRLLDESNLKQLMDATALKELRDQLENDVQPATEENVRATLQTLSENRHLTFQRGLVNCFTKLERRFKSHDGFKIGSRIIFERAFDREWGWKNHGGTWDVIADIERVMAVLDNQPPNRRALEAAVGEDRKGMHGAQQSSTEATYFKLNAFKNGNAHLWFTRDDLVEKANKILADYYGEVLPDAYDEGDDENLFTGTAVSKDLQFFRSGQPVVDRLFQDLHIAQDGTTTVLEPSAGDGAISDRAAALGASVRAIEFDQNRFDILDAKSRRHKGSTYMAEKANFLKVRPIGTFDYVLMNPPFYGTHWMDHVKHAFKFLKAGGKLRAVVPASAQVNETKKHDAFRKWAKQYSDYSWNGCFEELPEGSFAESGTNIQTVIIHLRKK